LTFPFIPDKKDQVLEDLNFKLDCKGSGMRVRKGMHQFHAMNCEGLIVDILELLEVDELRKFFPNIDH